jgi:maltooligosyltrehalose synthase
MLSEIEAMTPRELLAAWRDGLPKLAAMHRLLVVRRERPALFLEGRYVAVEVDGRRAEHVIAFERRRGRERALVVVPRRTVGLVDDAQGLPRFHATDLVLPAGSRGRRLDVLSGDVLELGERVRVDDLLGAFPVSVCLTR